MNHILFFNTWGTTNKTKRAEHTTFSSLHNIIPQKNFFYVPSQPNPRNTTYSIDNYYHYTIDRKKVYCTCDCNIIVLYYIHEGVI